MESSVHELLDQERSCSW